MKTQSTDEKRVRDILFCLRLYEERVKVLQKIASNGTGAPHARKELLLEGLENILSDQPLRRSDHPERQYWTALVEELQGIAQHDAGVRQRVQELFSNLKHIITGARKYGSELREYGLGYLKKEMPVPSKL